jgi:hypothetical protein
VPSAYATPLLLAGEGAHHVEARAGDRLGNEAVTNATFLVDDTPSRGAVSVGLPRFASDRLYVTSETPITLSFQDGGLIPVGLDRSEFRVDGGDWLAYASSLTLWGSDGSRTIETRGTDRLGNQEIGATVVYVDNSPPATSISPTASAGPNTRFTLTATDTGSGVARTEYRIDAGNWTTYAEGFPLPAGDHVIGYRSIDNLEHEEEEKELAVGAATVVAAETNWKPLVAAVFAVTLLVVGLRSAQRAPWKGAVTRRGRSLAFLITSLPFVAAEVVTGIVSAVTGLLSIPPVLGAGTAVDVGILAVGVIVALWRGRPPNTHTEDQLAAKGS